MTEKGKHLATDWSLDAHHVVRALRYIRSKAGGMTAEDLVEWDARNGKQLFEWDDAAAGEEYRRHQARLFFNRFRIKIGDFRIRGFINVRDETSGDRRYWSVEEITDQPDARVVVIGDLTRRMGSLASELRFWQLNPREREQVIEHVRERLGGE